MQVIRTETGDSPTNPGFSRISVEIGLESRSGKLAYWFDFPSQHRTSLRSNGNPWLILMLPIACTIGESINLSLAVDPLLLSNLRGLQRLWRSWYPSLRPVQINAPVEITPPANRPRPDGRRSAAFFSGGIDSYFTLLRHRDRPNGDGSSAVDDLITLAGFNTPIEDRGALATSLGPIAREFGKNFVLISTNIRYSKQVIDTPYSNPHQMIYVAHGAALGACAHLLGGRYKEVLIPSSNDYGNLVPYGSHPMSDRLLSSRDLSIVHDGASFTRVEKTAAVAGFEPALRTMHVCWRDRATGNCSSCLKCLHTMAALDVLGVSADATSFDWSGYDAQKLSRVWLPDPTDIDEFVEVALEADRRGRKDVSAAMWKSVQYSRRKQRILSLINRYELSRRSWGATREVRQAIRSLGVANLSPRRAEGG